MLIALPIGLILAGIAGAMAGLGLGNTVAAVRMGSVFAVLTIFLLPLRWWLAWSLVVPVTVLEGGGLRVSARRSKYLTQGRRTRVFIVYMLIAVLTWVLSIIFQLPFYLTAGWRVFRNPAIGGPLSHILSVVGSFASSSLVGPLLTIAFTLIYYDERVRKEGFDLQFMMSALESSPQVTAAVAS
jgi:hypothetical protein